jgi:hypothetical protein
MEPFFLDNARLWAEALQEAGANVVMHERDVAHGAERWRAEFSHMLKWAFG